MKKRSMLYFSLLVILMISSNLFAQYVQVDFEDGGVGTDWEWVVTENDDNPPLEFIDNPDNSGINTSATVSKFTARASGPAWALCFTDSNGEFTFDATNSTVTIMVNKPVISNVGMKFEGPSTPIEIQVPNTVTNQWEEITFDFSGSIGNTYNRAVIIPDFAERDQEHIIYFDNIQLPEGEYIPIEEPETAAPTPTVPSENVISLFSNAYTNVPIDTWSADWDQADLADVQIQGNDTKLYTNLVFAGIEFITETIDASGMSYFHMDLWTPDPTTAPATFRIKLVDFGADGVYDGGDDVEHELTFDATTAPALVTGEWISFDLPMSFFSNLITVEHLAQLIISGDPNTYYIDNVFFHSGGTQAEPEVAAPTPTQQEENVVSLFSNAYTDVPVDTWSADWDAADVSDVQVAGDDVKLYTSLSFAGIEFTSQTIDASGMNYFHMDIWTPDQISSTGIFKIKLVDFGADGVYDGGDDVEYELTFDQNSDPALVSQQWVSFDIPMSDFTDLVTTGHLAQLIISGDPNTVYIDNIYFYDNSSASDDISESVNSTHKLGNNHPNPFNPVTTINYSVSKPGFVSLKVYNVKGSLVETLVEENKNANSYQINWNADNAPSGVYYYRLMVNNKIVNTKSMILLK